MPREATRSAGADRTAHGASHRPTAIPQRLDHPSVHAREISCLQPLALSADVPPFSRNHVRRDQLAPHLTRLAGGLVYVGAATLSSWAYVFVSCLISTVKQFEEVLRTWWARYSRRSRISPV